MRAWLEIDLGVIARNFRRVQEHLGDTEVCAVVKANAYGHGIEAVVRCLDGERVHSFAVISFDEAVRVRSQSDKDVLIFGYLDDSEIAEAIERGFVLSVYDRKLADTVVRIAAEVGKAARAQLKVETGLNRLGMDPGEALELLAQPHLFPGLSIEAVFTHLTSSGRRDRNLDQLLRFAPFLSEKRRLGVDLPIHMKNSHALSVFPEGRFHRVRLGLALYGVEPVLDGLEPSLEAKTVVIQRKVLRKGEGTSYNHLYVAEEDREIAVIAMGYAEGLSQMMTGKIHALVNGHKVPVIGQICMNLAVIDVTGIAAERGDEVVLIGKQGNVSITVAEVAAAAGIRHHEILTRLGTSIPKVYVGEASLDRRSGNVSLGVNAASP